MDQSMAILVPADEFPASANQFPVPARNREFSAKGLKLRRQRALIGRKRHEKVEDLKKFPVIFPVLRELSLFSSVAHNSRRRIAPESAEDAKFIIGLQEKRRPWSSDVNGGCIHRIVMSGDNRYFRRYKIAVCHHLKKSPRGVGVNRSIHIMERSGLRPTQLLVGFPPLTET